MKKLFLFFGLVIGLSLIAAPTFGPTLSAPSTISFNKPIQVQSLTLGKQNPDSTIVPGTLSMYGTINIWETNNGSVFIPLWFDTINWFGLVIGDGVSGIQSNNDIHHFGHLYSRDGISIGDNNNIDHLPQGLVIAPTVGNASYSIQRPTYEDIDSIDMISPDGYSAGWSIQMQASLTNFVVLNRLLNQNSIEIDQNNGDITLSGNLLFPVHGTGLVITESAADGNPKMGIATLNGTTGVTISTSVISANSRIFLAIQSPAGTVGTPYIASRTAGTSFVIKSTSGTDVSSVAWIIVEPR